MNSRISKKLIINKFRHHFYHFFYSQSVCKYSSINYSNIFYCKKFSSSPCLKYYSQKNLYNKSTSLSVLRRYISNNISDIQNNDKVTTDLSPAEEAINLTQSVVPNFVNYMSDWKIVQLAQQTLLNMHDITGLPWWASIVVSAFIARMTITFPFTIMQIRTAANLEKIKLEIDEFAKQLMIEAYYKHNTQGWPKELLKKDVQKKIKTEMKDLIIKNNCHPAKCFIPTFIQIPIWIAFSCAIRNLCFMLPQSDFMAQITHMELTVGGFGWIRNLVDIDHYMILPILLGLLNLTILEVPRLFRNSQTTKYEKWIQIFFRIFIIATIPIAMYLPAAVNCYWITSSACGVLQIFLTNSTRIRRLFNIPVMKSELKNPYQHFYNNLKLKLTYK